VQLQCIEPERTPLNLSYEDHYANFHAGDIIEEVKALLGQLNGEKWLMCALMYGAGLWIMECPRLRVQDRFSSEIGNRLPF
jgi:hypothetical protein